jgi:glycosyltransferase involved in cell wall biosynthesis
MVGPYPEQVLTYARNMGLNDQHAHFTGPVSYQKVAEYLQASSALVLYSRYENLPCVILEALCCGLPVISTPVGGIAEVINAGNGILIDSEDEEQLTTAFVQMYTNYHQFDQAKISDAATSLYSYAAVGSLINAVYSNVHLPG